MIAPSDADRELALKIADSIDMHPLQRQLGGERVLALHVAAVRADVRTEVVGEIVAWLQDEGELGLAGSVERKWGVAK